ncbi:predicted protein [Botrytis cinerea T4]|uniref:Uncharacterized protein n=1 Tax=Botryotinia fuckeliana (strain T4) TaxID=999810 RepID=G2YG79_BOTF4|nr:predicted protein [Botrytis cinerea T4]
MRFDSQLMSRVSQLTYPDGFSAGYSRWTSEHHSGTAHETAYPTVQEVSKSAWPSRLAVTPIFG